MCLAHIREQIATVGKRPDARALALALGFGLLPCHPNQAVELERTTSELVAWGVAADRAEEQARIRLALARGLLLRSGSAHTVDDVAQLAELLKTQAQSST